MLDRDIERAMLARFGEVDVLAKDALRDQLQAVVISEEWIADDRGRGALDLEFSREVAPLASLHGFPIHGWYTDGDGEVVLLPFWSRGRRTSSAISSFGNRPSGVRSSIGHRTPNRFAFKVPQAGHRNTTSIRRLAGRRTAISEAVARMQAHQRR